MNNTPSVKDSMDEETANLLRGPHHSVDIHDVDTNTNNNDNSCEVSIPLLKITDGHDEEADLSSRSPEIEVSQTCITIDADEDQDVPPVAVLQSSDVDRIVTRQTPDTRDTVTEEHFSSVGTVSDQNDTDASEGGPRILNIPATEHPADETPHSGREVIFRDSQGRQLMVAKESELAAISPVFRAQFSQRWRESGSDSTIHVENPAGEAEAFTVILRFSQGADLQLTEDNVWHVLQVADMYEVLPVVDQCFHFLLHRHSRRQRSQHICVVLEMAHRFSYPAHHEDCMNTLKQNAKKILRNASALSELCHQCMLHLVKSDDLDVPEICIHDAVIKWALSACAERGETTPSLEMARATAGNLIYHVRYLTIPHQALKNLANKSGHISSLLTDTELGRLLNRDAGGFPKTIDIKRQSEQRKTCPCNAPRKMEKAVTVMFIVGLFLLFLFAVVFVPIKFAVENL